MATEENNPVHSGSVRAEIDTSAPFESVKEAASRFGGMGFWKPSTQKTPENGSVFVLNHKNEADISQVEEEAAKLEQDLITKERETMDVLTELESTMNIVEELKLKLQKETSEIDAALNENEEDKSNLSSDQNGGLDIVHQSSSPGYILLELKQAKVNLTRTTNDLTDIRATVDSYSKKIEKERLSLEKTRERLLLNTSKISSLEEEVNQTRQLLGQVKDKESPRDNARDPLELKKLSSETKQFKEVGEAAKSQVSSAMSEIEQTKSRIRTAEIRLVAAKKMKEAAKASEAVALAEIKALSKSQKAGKTSSKNAEDVTLTFEEYSSLLSKAREAEEANRAKVKNAMLRVDEANTSKAEIFKRVEEATQEFKTSKEALEEALARVEEANKGKLAVEEALRKWRSDHGHKRRSVHNDTKFKREACGLDANVANNELKQQIPTLSIGQILSRKLLLTEEYSNGTMEKRKASLGSSSSSSKLDDNGGNCSDCGEIEKPGKENKEQQTPTKRKKFGLARISRLVGKQGKKKNTTKKQSGGLMCRSVEI